MYYNARYKYWAWLIVAVFMLLVSRCGYAQSNYGFEDSNLTGWTAGGGATGTVITGGWSPNGSGVNVTTGISNYSPGGGKTWTIMPYGSYMVSIQPGGAAVTFDSAVSSLGLTATENTAIKNYLTFQANNGGGGNPTPTNASWIRRTVTLQPGVTYTFAWNYLSTDYTPWNDGSMMTLTHSTNANIIPTLNNSQQRYALLGFTNPGTGNYATGSYGSTGWQVAVFTVPQAGDYVLGFVSFNLGDTALSPILLIDQTQGTTTLNGQTFGPVQPNAGSSAPAAPSEPTYVSNITSGQQANYDSAITRRNAITGNSIYLDQQIGSNNNSITIEQHSSHNSVRGWGGQQYATVSGSGNNITIRQGDPANIVGKNSVELQLQGSNNTLEINQARIITTGAADGWDSNGHAAGIKITGSSNVFRTQQTNTATGPHYMEVDLAGNNNNATFRQLGDNTKRMWGIITGSSNTLNILQGDGGSHYLDLTVTGNGHNVSVTQRNNGSHRATINLANVGGSSNLTLLQQGNTDQVYNITQQCANLSGCSVSVTQGTGP